jgi:hypothetical protein
MRRSVLVVVLVATAIRGVVAQPTEVDSRVASVGMFKNGLAVVRRTVQVSGPGSYRLTDVPEPVHGTWWIESDTAIETRVTQREILVPLRAKGGIDFQNELAGQEVTIHFREGNIPPASGKVMTVEPAKGADAWSRRYEQPRYYGYYAGYRGREQPAGRYLILETKEGRTYVDTATIAYARVKGTTRRVREKRPVLLLTVGKTGKRSGTVSITYLAKGLAWAPSYRVDISDPKQLAIRQKAVIKNELTDLENAEMQLISGFPSIQFAHVTSPLSSSSTRGSGPGAARRT